MDFTWLGIQIYIFWSQIPLKVGAWNRKPVSIWCDHHLPHAARHLLCIEFIRLMIVPCGMLSHSSSMAVWSCWILAGTGTYCCTRWSRASQTCSMGDHVWWVCKPWKNWHFQLPGIVYRSLRHGAVHYHAKTWGDRGGWMAWQWISGSRHGISVNSNCHR